jgi:hypothetical protein
LCAAEPQLYATDWAEKVLRPAVRQHPASEAQAQVEKPIPFTVKRPFLEGESE